MPDPLSTYIKLLERLDAFFQRVKKCCGHQLSCKPGCSDCCQVDLSIYSFEAERLVNAARRLDLKTQARVLERVSRVRSDSSAACVFLEQGICLVYEHRPVICRTQGLMLLIPRENSVSVCPNNFKEQSRLKREHVLDLTPVNQILATVSHLASGGFERVLLSKQLLADLST